MLSKYRTAATAGVAPLLAVVALSPAAAYDPAAGPATGTCLALIDKTQHQVTSADERDCAAAHNAEVTGQIAVPEDIAATGRDSATTLAYLARTCQPVTRDYIWNPEIKTKMARSNFPDASQAITGWVVPETAAWDNGARWVSCLGINVDSKGVIADRVGTVADTGPGPTQCVLRTTYSTSSCDLKAKKIFRTAGIVWLAKDFDEAFPGKKAVLKRADKACTKLAKRTKGRPLAQWVRTSAGWDQGDKWAKCAITWKRA